MAQTSYGYTTPKGVAGGLYDLSPHPVESRLNGEDTAGALKFGMGAVQGANPGVDVKVPTESDAADKFEGLVLTGFIQEMDMTGDTKLFPKQTVGILPYGKAWARVVPGVTVSYGEQLYVVKTGDNAGLFTNDDADAFAVNGRFIGAVDSSDIAPVELYNQNPSLGGKVTALDESVASLDERVTALEGA